uniref:Uncharacterized protein n=1 Tax=Octopus bimaculoides TaxID=37653 RepID=A0A0L8I8A1_OCTBM
MRGQFAPGPPLGFLAALEWGLPCKQPAHGSDLRQRTPSFDRLPLFLFNLVLLRSLKRSRLVKNK